MEQPHALSIHTLQQDLPQVEELLDNYIGKQAKRYGDILIAITEALNNALIHGNKKDTSKKTSLILRYEKNQKGAEQELIHILTLIVTDEGTPFDHNVVPDPTDEDYIHKEGGRGLFLMKKLSDTILFQHTGNGNQITMTFHIPVGAEHNVV